MAGCPCCGRTNAIYSQVRAPDGLPSRAVVCGLCSRHQGSHEIDLKRRSEMHIEMWREDLAEQEERLTDQRLRETAGLELTIAELRQELEERPVQVVYENVDKQTLDDAISETNRAFRSRDRVLRDMTTLHLKHFETGSGRCRCGKPADDCDERVILDGSRALRAWERRHTEYRRRGEPHSLPHGHPGVVDARWDPDTDRDLYDEFEDGPAGWK
jgi:hypothetical protein